MYLYVQEDFAFRQSTDEPKEQEVLEYHYTTGTPILKFENGQFFESEISSEEVEIEPEEGEEPEYETQYSLSWFLVKQL